MSFFDDKQEILKIELTTYGRYLISRGKFKPVYYAFFDDDVLYDASYSGVDETQNSIQTRILEETPYLKPQTTFTSIENSVKLSTLLAEEEGKLKLEEQQISADKNYALTYPLGNSSHNSDYSPSWNVSMLEGKISGSVTQFIENTSSNYEVLQPFLRFPQITLEESAYNILKQINNSSAPIGFDSLFTFYNGSDQYEYFMSEKPIIMAIQEYNVDDNLKNFDVELFIDREEIIPGTEQTRIVSQKLNFKKEKIEIVDGILLDEPLTFDVAEDSTFSEYFFEITIDEEIQLPPNTTAIGITSGPVGTYSSNTNPYSNKRGNNGPFGVDC